MEDSLEFVDIEPVHSVPLRSHQQVLLSGEKAVDAPSHFFHGSNWVSLGQAGSIDSASDAPGEHEALPTGHHVDFILVEGPCPLYDLPVLGEMIPSLF